MEFKNHLQILQLFKEAEQLQCFEWIPKDHQNASRSLQKHYCRFNIYVMQFSFRIHLYTTYQKRKNIILVLIIV